MLVGYIQYKAQNLLDVGFELYRQNDFFLYPPTQMSHAEMVAIQSGAEQLIAGAGFSEELPITNIGLNHLILLGYIFHLQPERRGIHSNEARGEWTDRLDLQHVVNQSKITLHLKSSDSDRDKSTRRQPLFQPSGPDCPLELQRCPSIVEFDVFRTGNLGVYRYEIWTNCQSEGSIKYFQTMNFWAPDAQNPCLVLALEQGAWDGATIMFCAFWGRRHLNFGSLPALDAPIDFEVRSLEKARELLKLEDL